MWNAWLVESQTGIKTERRNINNFRYADGTMLMAESEEELKSLLMGWKRRVENVGLEHNIQKTKIIASSPITFWQIDGETMEKVTDFIFLCSKITADSDCSHEIERHLLLGRKAMTNLDSVLKCRDITLPTKVCIVKAMIFLVVMYRCESWTIKKAECQRINAFELQCWRRLLRIPWIARRSNHSILNKSILNIHCKDWCWSSNTLATWFEELTHWKRPWCWEILKAKGEGSGREWDGWAVSHTQWSWTWANSRSERQGSLACCSSWGHKKLDMS